MQQWREISFFSGYEDIGYQINGLSQYFSELTFFFQYFWLVCSAPDMPTCRSFFGENCFNPPDFRTTHSFATLGKWIAL